MEESISIAELTDKFFGALMDVVNRQNTIIEKVISEMQGKQEKLQEGHSELRHEMQALQRETQDLLDYTKGYCRARWEAMEQDRVNERRAAYQENVKGSWQLKTALATGICGLLIAAVTAWITLATKK